MMFLENLMLKMYVVEKGNFHLFQSQWEKKIDWKMGVWESVRNKRTEKEKIVVNTKNVEMQRGLWDT